MTASALASLSGRYRRRPPKPGIGVRPIVDCGFSLRDWRYVVRIANIDVSDLAGATPVNLINLLIRAAHKVPNIRMGRPAIYCNRAIATWLDIQALNKANVNLRYAEVFGEEVLTFRKIRDIAERAAAKRS